MGARSVQGIVWSIWVTFDGNLNCAAYPVLPELQLDRAAEFVGNEFADHAGAVAWHGSGAVTRGAPIFTPLEPQLCRLIRV